MNAPSSRIDFEANAATLSAEESRLLDHHLAMVVKACHDLVPDLRAVILYGGYGRGEGSWYQNTRGECTPYNDYDVCVVSDSFIDRIVVNSVARDLAETIGIRWIDLSIVHPAQLARLQRSIYSFDLKNASTVIEGDGEILDLIPSFAASEIPLKDVAILYFTRLFTLLGCFDETDFINEVTGDSSRYFRNQMAKAVLAVVDVLLLTRGSYHTSYQRRVELVADIWPSKEEVVKLSNWALTEKLRPQAPSMTCDEVAALYRSVRRIFLSEMYAGLGEYFCRTIREPSDIEHCAKWQLNSVLKRIYRLLRKRNWSPEREVNLQLAQSYLVAGYDRHEPDARSLRNAIRLLRKVDSSLPETMNWEVARQSAIRLRLEK